MSFAALIISGREWLLPAAGVLAVAVLSLLWAYRRAVAEGWVRGVCLFLKLLGIAALLACLLEPLWSGQRARPGANYFALVADNSQGMQIKDRGDTKSRGEFLRAALTDDKAQWQAKLEENFQLRRYLFDARLQSTKDFGELAFDGRASSIAASLRTLAERYKGQPLAGVLMFTDGNATDITDGSPDLAGLPPIYPVVIGRDLPTKDIAVNNVTVSQTAFEDAPVSIQADVNAVGYAGASITAQIFEIAQAARPAGDNVKATNNTAQAANLSRTMENARKPKDSFAATNITQTASTNKAPAIAEKMVAEQTLRAPRDGEPLAYRFQIRPDKTGVVFYRLRFSAKSELDQFAKPELSTEATLANNSRVLVVDRGHGPYRVLYVAGRPNWEYKFLHRAIEQDEQVRMVGLIRVARRERKFEFLGRRGESSNPLFRGFGNQSKEETESYDQPVLRRLFPYDTPDELELAGGFPKAAEELYVYHAIILDDLESEFFTPDQMTLVQKFVSERGGGFLMLGGAESFVQGKFHRTPIGDMLPVYLDQVVENRPATEFRLNLTPEGWLQPWARLRNNESDEKARLDEMPPFQVLNPVRGIKPGASVLATVTDSSANKYPAVIVQRFGSGRTAALTIGDLWHWGLRDEKMHRDMDKAWRQLVRWLVADVPQRVELQTEYKKGDANQAVQLQVRVRDQKFQPLDNAKVTVTVRSLGQAGAPAPTGETSILPIIRLEAEPALNEPGLYQATYIPRETGGYYAEAGITNAVGAEVGRAEAGWTSDPAADEFRSLKPNRALLETIAKKTGGEIIGLNALEEFARDLPHRTVPITETWSYPLWHKASVFLFALACFISEWGLRRWKGLV